MPALLPLLPRKLLIRVEVSILPLITLFIKGLKPLNDFADTFCVFSICYFAKGTKIVDSLA